MTTNEQIAALLLQQTYAERIEMAQWFRDVCADRLTDDQELDADYLAFLFGSWADGELEEAEETP